MATWVETDVKILIDPGAALGPLRYSLPPSQMEEERLDILSEKVFEYAKAADIMTISHYHYDHYFREAKIYQGKTLLTKDSENNINKSQKERAANFLQFLNKYYKSLVFADGKEFEFGQTKIKFSPAVSHGPAGSKLGFVLMCSVSYNGKKLIHASDVEGFIDQTSRDWVIEENPDILILSGFPTLFLGYRFSHDQLLRSNVNLISVLNKTKVKTVILEHHLVRDLNYLNKIEPVLDYARKHKRQVITAAEFLGQKPEFLEAKRKELHKGGFSGSI